MLNIYSEFYVIFPIYLENFKEYKKITSSTHQLDSKYYKNFSLAYFDWNMITGRKIVYIVNKI